MSSFADVIEQELGAVFGRLDALENAVAEWQDARRSAMADDFKSWNRLAAAEAALAAVAAQRKEGS